MRHEHHRQGDHDRLEPQVTDEHAIDRARNAGGRHARQSPGELPAGRGRHATNDKAVGQGDDRPGREVETAEDHRQGLAHRADRQCRGVAERRGEIVIAERLRQHEVEPAEDDSEHHDRHNEAAVAAERGANSGPDAAARGEAAGTQSRRLFRLRGEGHTARSNGAEALPCPSAKRMISSSRTASPASSALIRRS